jgi:hypothetical protein
MRDGTIAVYLEIKSTIETAAKQIWHVLQISIITIWSSFSIIKFVQFSFFLIFLLLSIPDLVEHFKKALIKFAKI